MWNFKPEPIDPCSASEDVSSNLDPQLCKSAPKNKNVHVAVPGLPFTLEKSNYGVITGHFYVSVVSSVMKMSATNLICQKPES